MKIQSLINFAKGKEYVFANNIFEEGGSSLLYECWREGHDSKYVAKVPKKNYGELNIKLFKTECKILRKFKGKSHIIQVVDIVSRKGGSFIVLPKMVEDLCAEMGRQVDYKYPESIAKKIFSQICTGVKHLHSKKVAHLDIKPGNILRGPDNKYYLTDFGGALKKMRADDSAFVTKEYAAPEIYSEGPLTHLLEADVWSLGVLLYEMLTGSKSMFEKEFTEVNITDLIDVMMHTHSPDVCDLIYSMLRFEPKKRISITEILKHPWLNTN